MAQFQPGNPGGPGRPAGSRNKFSEAFVKALSEDFAKNGVAAIAQLREEDIAAYIRSCVSLVPKDFNLNVNDNRSLDEYTTEELFAIRDQLGASTKAERKGKSSKLH